MGVSSQPLKLEIACPATLQDVRDSVVRVLEWLRGRDFDTGLDAIEIALAEALTNIVEHAYVDTATGWMRVCCMIRNREIVIRVLDVGIAFTSGISITTTCQMSMFPPHCSAKVDSADR